MGSTLANGRTTRAKAMIRSRICVDQPTPFLAATRLGWHALEPRTDARRAVRRRWDVHRAAPRDEETRAARRDRGDSQARTIGLAHESRASARRRACDDARVTARGTGSAKLCVAGGQCDQSWATRREREQPAAANDDATKVVDRDRRRIRPVPSAATAWTRRRQTRSDGHETV